MTEEPTWRIRERLIRQARENIEGRASFEKHVGRKSEKPLTPVTVDPRDLLRVLTEEREVEHDEQCAEELRFSGACRHGHGFRGNCEDATCTLNHDEETK